MSKLCLIDTFSHPISGPWVRLGLWAAVLACGPADLPGQDDSPTPKYPLAVAVDGEDVYTVDLDLPGVWKTGADGRELFVRGSNLLRKPMNRPRPITLHPQGGILVGDSATREIYWIESAGADPKPLNAGYLGIPMALAVSPDGKTLFVGDTERRALFRLPIEGGKPELVARVNPRGLGFDTDGKLWAVTPDADAVVRVDVESGEVEVIVGDRPFQFPNGLGVGGRSWLCHRRLRQMRLEGNGRRKGREMA